MGANDRIELVGFLLILAFFGIVWWPSALLIGGLSLVAVATFRDREAKRVTADDEEPTP